MMRVLLKAKIHRATVTDRSLDYEGSITIDEDLMDAVGLLPNEQVQVYNVSNGHRFETYAIPGKRGSGEIGLNGAATHRGSVGDRVIVFAFCLVPSEEAPMHRPLILVLDEHNKPVGGLKEV